MSCGGWNGPSVELLRARLLDDRKRLLEAKLHEREDLLQLLKPPKKTLQKKRTASAVTAENPAHEEAVVAAAAQPQPSKDDREGESSRKHSHKHRHSHGRSEEKKEREKKSSKEEIRQQHPNATTSERADELVAPIFSAKGSVSVGVGSVAAAAASPVRITGKLPSVSVPTRPLHGMRLSGSFKPLRVPAIAISAAAVAVTVTAAGDGSSSPCRSVSSTAVAAVSPAVTKKHHAAVGRPPKERPPKTPRQDTEAATRVPWIELITPVSLSLAPSNSVVSAVAVPMSSSVSQGTPQPPSTAIPSMGAATPTPTPTVPVTPTLTAAVIPEVHSELADRDAQALRRIDELIKEGRWGGAGGKGGAIPRCLNPPRDPPKNPEKCHWDYLLREMEWMAKDFKNERARKLGQAKKAARTCAKEVREESRRRDRAEKEAEVELRRKATAMARMVKGFWSQIGKIMAFKLQSKLDAHRSEAITKHLDFVVGQTERLSKMIAMDLSKSTAVPSITPEVDGDADAEAGEQQQQQTPEEDGSEATETSELNSREKIERAAKEADAAMPTGTTLATTLVKTPLPQLLRGTLREYQHVGLDWMATMYEKKLNVILADEMGLGKTIMTISLLAHLAGERQNWGPHLIVVPSSTVMNWELELKKWCPALKVVTYIGTPKERRQRRAGWSKENAMHVCITSYRLALQDSSLFRRRKWCYMILDEAQNIKNFRSQRWQTLLQFHSERRLLLTGTPLQNSIMELWSLMHFLMPAVFASHAEFAEWFAVPLTAMVEKGASVDPEIVQRLHSVLRPFLLRRVKRDVERNLPPKREVIVPCRLSRRQQFLYEEFIGASQTQETLASGSFFGVVNILMQLRKVCNHPDLFAERPTDSPFDTVDPIELVAPSAACCVQLRGASLPSLALVESTAYSSAFSDRFSELASLWATGARRFAEMGLAALPGEIAAASFVDCFARERARASAEDRLEALRHVANVTGTRALWCHPMYGGETLREVVTVRRNGRRVDWDAPPIVRPVSLSERINEWTVLAQHFVCLHPKVRAPPQRLLMTHASSSLSVASAERDAVIASALAPMQFELEPIAIRLQMHFPDKRLLQYDCGKLQELAVLLRRLHDTGHKVVLFTQMSRVLDIIESFANMHRFIYLRLDGTTRTDRRQILVERFNRDPRIFLFLSTTRSGGFGINLTGADTVVFYDSDWNPAIDAQAQDRCHRIGQTREVTIYRLVTEMTVEENILKKAHQKKTLNKMVIKDGSFTTDFLSELDLSSLIVKPSMREAAKKRRWLDGGEGGSTGSSGEASGVAEKELEAAMANAEDEPDRQAEEQQEMEEKEMEDEFDENQPVPPPQDITPTPKLSRAASRQQQPQTTSVPSTLGEMAAEDEMVADACAAASEPASIESEMSGLQLYALRFLETVDPVKESDQIEELRAELDAKFGSKEKEWNLADVETPALDGSEGVSAEADADAGDGEPEIQEPPKKKRGRPKKRPPTPPPIEEGEESDEEEEEEEDAESAREKRPRQESDDGAVEKEEEDEEEEPSRARSTRNAKTRAKQALSTPRRRGVKRMAKEPEPAEEEDEEEESPKSASSSSSTSSEDEQ